MDGVSHRGGTAAGQASVEHVGLVVVVALVLSGIGAWVATHVHPDRTPPPAVSRIWSGLDRIPESQPPVADLGIRPGGSGRVGSLVRRFGYVIRRGNEIVAVGAGAFASGFGHGLASAFTGFLRDPVAVLADGGGLLSQFAHDPTRFAKAQLAAAIAYAHELRSLPPTEAYRTFMRDLGEATADATIARGKGQARRAMLRALRRRLEQRGGVALPPAPDERGGN